MLKKKSSARRTRRAHNPAFKAKVALAALSNRGCNYEQLKGNYDEVR